MSSAASGTKQTPLDGDGTPSESGMVNPHVPEYMAKRPWYAGEGDAATLDHQRAQAKEKYDNKAAFHNYQRAKIEAPKPWAKFGLGARNRALRDADEFALPTTKAKRRKAEPSSEIKNPNLSFDAKRDRYNGYDPDEHMKTVERFNKLEAMRKEIRAEQKAKRLAEKALAEKETAENGHAAASKDVGEESDSSSSSSSDSEFDSDSDDDDELKIKAHEDKNMTSGRAQVGAKSSQVGLTIKNLRQRENTAKYLMNLNPNSAYYDPKSRSMRANPHPELDPSESEFVGDNASRVSGDAVRMAQTQVFAWDQYSAGGSAQVNVFANPTEVELAKKQFQERAAKVENMKKQTLLSKYGVESQAMPHPASQLLLGATENYVEYSADGRVIKGHAPAVPKSKYEEGVFLQNHTSVWGSYFDMKTEAWGYDCCWSTIKNSYCVGDALKEK